MFATSQCSTNPISVKEVLPQPHIDYSGGPPQFPPPPLRHIYQNHPSVVPQIPPRRCSSPEPSPDMVGACPTVVLLQREGGIQVELADLEVAYHEKLLERSKLRKEILSRSDSGALKKQNIVQHELFPPTTPSPSPFLSYSSWFSPSPSIPLPCPQDKQNAILKASQTQLEQSGWYYGKLSWQESVVLLQDSPQGTFLIRDSSSQDRFYPYSLSLQRKKEGPTSIRIQFANGKFSLHASAKIRLDMPQFESVGHLVVHYIEISKKRGKRDILIEQEDELEVSGLVLTSPALKTAPSLGHAARLAIHNALGTGSSSDIEHLWEKQRYQLQLPDQLIKILDEYQLSI